MTKKEEDAFDIVTRLLRRRHGPRSIQVLKVFLPLLAVVAIAGFFLAPAPWNAGIFALSIVLMIFSPFLLLPVLEVWRLAAPQRYATWKARLTRGMREEQRQVTRQEVREKLSKTPPFAFEHLVADVYHAHGYSVRVTPQVGDFGVDILMTGDSGRKYAVQVKRFTTGTAIGRPDLQRLWSATHDLGYEVPVFVTLSHFSEPARLYAEGKGIHLVDGDDFIDMYLEVQDRVNLLAYEQPPQGDD